MTSHNCNHCKSSSRTTGGCAVGSIMSPLITATGRGEIRIKPTKATITLTVQTKNALAAAAASENAKIVVSSAQYTGDNVSSARIEALKAAVSAARRDAKAMALAAGGSSEERRVGKEGRS